MLDQMRIIGPPGMAGPTASAQEEGQRKTGKNDFSQILDQTKNDKSGSTVLGKNPPKDLRGKSDEGQRLASQMNQKDRLERGRDEGRAESNPKRSVSRENDRKAAFRNDSSVKSREGTPSEESEKDKQVQVKAPKRSSKVGGPAAEKNSERSERYALKNSEPPIQDQSRGTQIDQIESDQAEVGVRRKAVILEFMDSFESEFEVPPARLVQAMAKLTPQELQLSPEKTAAAVIHDLQLPPEQEQRAQAMYVSLLLALTTIDRQGQIQAAANTMKSAVGRSLNPVAATLESNMRSQLMGIEKSPQVGRENAKVYGSSLAGQMPEKSSQELNSLRSLNGGISESDADGRLEQALQALEHAVDELEDFSNSIATRGESSAFESGGSRGLMAGKSAESAQLLQYEKLPPHLAGQLKQASGADSATMAQQAHRMNSLQAELSKLNQSAAKDLQSKLEGKESLRIESNDDSMMLNKLMGDAEGGVNFQQMSQKGDMKDSFQGSGEDAGSSSWMNALTNQNVNRSESKKDLAFKQFMGKAREHEKLSSTDKIDQVLNTMISGEQRLSSTMNDLSAVAEPSIQPTPVDMQENLQKIMSHAQILANKGGGEVRMKLKPEGLGELELKMVLNQGRLQLHINADTNEAKKVLEQSLGDLKSSLAAHKLSIDHMKIDVVGASQTDVATQFQNSFQNHGQAAQNPMSDREQTSQFWQQFNQQFDTKQHRNFLMDPPQMVAGNPQKTEPLVPATQVNQARAARAYGMKGSGLNLVA